MSDLGEAQKRVDGKAPAPPKISRELWLQVEPLLATGLDMDAAARPAWLAGLAATHPAAEPFVRRLLEAHERAESSRELETLSGAAAPPEWESAHAPGERIGPFELQRQIGHGGMGEVWLARQADGRVERTVALKLPVMLQAGDTWRERFRRERDFLARLEHPNVARLYDAGVTDSGQPWLAMEFVEGHTLTEHVARHSLPLAQRLALFRQVLAAVAHAHRRLVVHRDLKPANVLIDATGQVKLLDFGIAKLVGGDTAHDDATALTRVGGRLMTLRYAAPEQVEAGEITTATDIYALGVILHELITGLSPYRAVRQGKALTESAMLGEQLTLPSRLARGLSGDLDSIVLKALQHDPAKRYASIESLDEDLLAHLENRPVKARDGTWRYLAGRFVARHKLPIAAAGAIVLALLAGLVVAERERRVAVAEKARAERHFASVRKLANTFVFDVHGKLEPLAGSLEARHLLVATALEYLDRLAAESRDDPELALEAAASYRRLAEVSGDSRGGHLGDPAAAQRYVERATKLLEAVEMREPGNLAALREHRVALLLLGRLRVEAGDADGLDDTAKAVAIAERAAGLPAATLDDRRNLGATLAEYGGLLAIVKNNHDAAAIHLGRAVAYLEPLARDNPGDLGVRTSLAYAYERGALAAEASGREELLPRAIELQERSVALTELVLRDQPGQISHAQTLVKRYNNAARMRLALGDVAGASEKAAKGRTLIERLVADDPRNVGNATMLASALAMSSGIEHQAGRSDVAIELARASIAVNARLPQAVRSGVIVRESLADAQRALAMAACTPTGRNGPASPPRAVLLKEARAQLLEARAFKRELVERGIDARDAGIAIGEIDAEIARCDRELAGPSA